MDTTSKGHGHSIAPEDDYGSSCNSSHLMQCHAGKININVERDVEIVGEDIQRDMSYDFGDLSSVKPCLRSACTLVVGTWPRLSNNSRANISAAVSLGEVPCPCRLLRIAGP
jgi:hypothetical protein